MLITQCAPHHLVLNSWWFMSTGQVHLRYLENFTTWEVMELPLSQWAIIRQMAVILIGCQREHMAG